MKNGRTDITKLIFAFRDFADAPRTPVLLGMKLGSLSLKPLLGCTVLPVMLINVSAAVVSFTSLTSIRNPIRHRKFL